MLFSLDCPRFRLFLSQLSGWAVPAAVPRGPVQRSVRSLATLRRRSGSGSCGRRRARVSSRSICMAIPIFVRRVAVSAGFRRVSTTAVLGDHAVWPVAVGLVASRPRTCGSWETCGSWVSWESATGPARHAVENERARLARKNEPEFLRTGIPQTLVSVADCALTVRPADASAEGAMPPQPGRGWGVQRRVAWDPGTATGRAVGRRPRSRRWPRCARPPTCRPRACPRDHCVPLGLGVAGRGRGSGGGG